MEEKIYKKLRGRSELSLRKKKMKVKGSLQESKYKNQVIKKTKEFLSKINKFLAKYKVKVAKQEKEEIRKYLKEDINLATLQSQLLKLLDSLKTDKETKKKIKYSVSQLIGLPLVKPRSLSIDTATKCNLKCRICSQWKDDNPYKKLDFKEVKELINQLHKWNPEIIFEFSGQEPLLNKKLLFKTLEYGSKKINMALSTNGLLMDTTNAKKLLDFNMHHISISLDGITPETNDYIRNLRGSFKKITQGIKNLVEYKKKNKHIQTAISITCVITNTNLNELLPLYALAKDLGVDCINYNAYTLDNSYFFNKKATYENNEFWVEKENIPQLRAIMNKLIELKKDDSALTIANDVSQLERIPDYFEKRQNFKKGICLAGYNYFHITNFGEITVCGKGPKLNIRDHNIEYIWNSANFWNTRIKTAKCSKPCLNNCFELI